MKPIKVHTYEPNHLEAFCLMKYQSKDKSVTEIIWNSRDGVTPFIVFAKDGTELNHVEWNEDRFAPNHQPKPGDRIFVDLTRARALGFARERVELYWEDEQYPMKEMGVRKEVAAEMLAEEIYGDGTRPDLITVSEDWLNRTLGSSEPVGMLLFCPNCGEQHVDRQQPDACENCGLSKSFHEEGLPYDIQNVGSVCDNFTAWLNPPHKSHRCQICYWTWRPADVPTNGVEVLETRTKDMGIAENRPMRFDRIPGPINEVKK